MSRQNENVVLRGAGGEFRMDRDEWLAATLLPLFTAPHDPILRGCWPFANDRTRQVTEDNARVLADYLEAALSDFPADDEDLPFPWDGFSGPAEVTLKGLIEFCRAGAFAVEQDGSQT